MWAQKVHAPKVFPLIAGFKHSTRRMEELIGNRNFIRDGCHMLDKHQNGLVIHGTLYS